MARIVRRAVATLTLAVPTGALAEPPKPASDRAAAQALFYEARGLMKDGKHALACPKLEESLRLDHGIGTEFNLADCNEKLGKVATAWSGFLEVASAAKAQGQPEREKVARERAKALAPRLSKLVIDVPASAPPGFEVTRDGTGVASASWGKAVPVDPGAHRVVASAPGAEPWEGVVNAAEGKVVRIAVPAVLVTPAPASPAAGPPAPVIEREPARAPVTPFPAPVIEDEGATRRTIGWIVGGLGVAGLGVGAGFGIDSLRQRDAAKGHCAGDLCDREGVSRRDRALRSGDVATVTTIAGAAALVGGLILVITAPSQREAPRTTAKLRAVPHVAPGGGGISFQGVLP
ncbi:MAG: hypothetical protein KF764_30895 [Labilithrix sp.]|nr:hypothetical protein [Labilithrix sp.]